MSEVKATAAPAATIDAPRVSVDTDAFKRMLDEAMEDYELHRALRQEEESVLTRLGATADGADIFKRQADLSERVYYAAIGRTRPQDWIVSVDGQGQAFAMLRASGASLVAELYDVRITNLRPTVGGIFRPEKEAVGADGSKYVLKAWCDATSRMNGRRVEHLMAARRSDEDFVGRLVDSSGELMKKRHDDEVYSANPTDLASAVHTLLLTKAVRVLCGMSRVPISELARAWQNTGKKVEDCTKGHGGGSADSRRTAALTPDALKAEVAKLQAEVLRLAGGSKTDAAKITRDITSNPEKNFRGFDDITRLSYDWQIENAWKALKKHPLYAPPKDAPAEQG